MSKLSFDSVDVLIYDPVPSNRTATRAAMYALGFRKTETVSTLEAFLEAVQKTPPDIALCEAQGGAEDLCAVIQQLRQGGAGHNPFIVIIVTAWEKNTAMINRVISSGADDLLLRPFSTAVLGSRIETHVERRKGFVITTDYVGPDRRKDTNRPSNVDLFEPPNSLKMKAKDKLPSDVIARRLESELKGAREKLTSEKLRRDSFQVCILWRLVQDAPIVAGQTSPDLAKLQTLAKSIELRSAGTEFQPAVEWCQSVMAAAEGLALGVDRNASMHLLGHAALSLHQVFHPEKTAADQLSEIDATVALIRARNQAEALAS
ncbi:MAG TPA: response regulator [Rhizomicrobium sp.]|nr:response regulator [Rhizomicrobium sp.]